MHHLVEEEHPIRSGSTSSLTLAINYNTTPRPNPIVYTVIFEVAMVLKDIENESFSSDTEPTDYCRSSTWESFSSNLTPQGLSIFSLPQKVV
jgi:hypothetical protein